MHRNARLTVWGRTELCRRIEAGRPVAHVADEMGVSRASAYKWWRRWVEEGPAGLEDRSSRPKRSPRRTPAPIERKIEYLRRRHKLGPARIAYRLDLAPSTVHRVLARRGLNRLSWMDRPTGRVIRRYERASPGELVHIDVKKLGRIPAGGGWRAHGRGNDGHHGRSGVGYAFIHSAVDDHSRLAYSEILDDEGVATSIAFWERARRWFELHGVTVREVLTDNGNAYRSHAFADLMRDQGTKHLFTRPRRPQTNGKVERFNRTLLDEWAYVRVYRSDSARNAALDRWLHTYNHHRCHTALGGKAPISRVNNVPGHYI
jgi:transposase InsO family protein